MNARRAAPAKKNASSNPSEREVLWGGPSGPGLVWVVGETTKNIETLSIGLAKNTEAIGKLAAVQAEHAQVLQRDERSRASQQTVLRNAVLASAGFLFFLMVAFFAWAESIFQNAHFWPSH